MARLEQPYASEEFFASSLLAMQDYLAVEVSTRLPIPVLLLAGGCCGIGSSFAGSPSCEKAHRKVKFEKNLGRIVGESADELVGQWGPASDERELRSGGSVLSWVSDSGTTTSSNATPIYNWFTGEPTGAYRSQSSSTRWSCTVRIRVDEDWIVTSYSYAGNSCY